MREVLVFDDDSLRQHFRRAADAYFLMFLLRGTDDIKKAFKKLVGTERVIVDASIIVPVLAETALPESEQRFIGLLRSARAAGVQLCLVDDVVNEVETHLHRLSLYHSLQQSRDGGALLDEPLLISAYRRASKTLGISSFDQFIERFMGKHEPTADLIDYLVEEIGFDHQSLEGEYARIDQARLEEVFVIWKKQKRRRPWVDEQAFEVLVWHDVRSYLLTERNRTQRHEYGHLWWWLTLDGTAFRLDKQLRAGKGVSICMSPDYFLRYLSLVPKDEVVEKEIGATMPLSAETMAFAYLSPDVREKAASAMEEIEGMPPYLRRRRLRELLNTARSETGEMLGSAIDGLEAQLEEHYKPAAPEIAGQQGAAD